MQKEIRTFIAVKIQAEEKLLKQLQRYKQLFKNDSIRWVNPENFHLTLRFIGNTNKQQLYELVDRMEEVAGNTKYLTLKPKETAYFKTKGKARVLLIKFEVNERLNNLVNEIEREVVNTGFHEERKPFRPHLTLGRIKHLESQNRFYSIIDSEQEQEYGEIEITEFILFKSILLPDGPVYEPIRKFELL